MGPSTDPLVVMLHYLNAIDRRLFEKRNPEEIFAKMREELPNLTGDDLVFAGTVADQIGRELRQISWRLRVKPEKPRKTMRTHSQNR